MVIDTESRTGETPIFEQRQEFSNISLLDTPTDKAQIEVISNFCKSSRSFWFPQKGACGSLLQLLFLSLWCEGRQGESERLEKGSGRLCDGVVDRLGSLALGNRRHNGVQWPLSRWLGDDSGDRVGHLLGIGRRGGSVLREKRRRKRIHSSLVEGGTLGICRVLMFRSNWGRVGSRLNNGGVDAKRSEFVAIGLGESLQGKLRRCVQSLKRQGQTPGNGPNVQQQTTALPPHVWQSRAVHTQHTEDIGIELLLDLLQGERFQWATIRYPGIVDHHVKTTCDPYKRRDGLLHGSVVRDIDFDDMQGKMFSLRQSA